MADRIAAFDWGGTRLGPVDDWPATLRTAVALMLDWPVPACIGVGRELLCLHNDAFRALLGAKPALGRPLAEVWPEAWSALAPIAARALAGTASQLEDLPLTLERGGRPEPVAWSLVCSPVRLEDGSVAGVMWTVRETSADPERRQADASRAALMELADRLRELEATADLAFAAGEILGRTLDVSRAGYGTVDPSGDTITIERDWTAPGTGSLAGVLRFRTFGSYLDDLQAGRTVVIADAYEDDRSRAGAAALEALGARALVNVPIMEGGALVAILYVNHPTPRVWTPAELAFVADVADRTRLVVERRRAQRELRESEARLRLAQEVGGIGLWDWDIRTGRVLWSEGHYRNWGLDRSVPPSFQAFLAAVHPADRPSITALMQSALAGDGDGHWSAEIRASAPGAARWVASRGLVLKDGLGQPVRMIGVNFDISERRRAEAAVQELNATLEQRVAEQAAERDQIWRLSRDPLLISDADGVWLHPSPAWTEILGWSEAELVGRTSEWMEHPDDRAKTRAEVARLRDGKLGLRFENRFRAKDGRYVWFSWTVVPKENRLFCVARDVTAEKQATAELAATQEQLRQAQKMEAVGQLTGGIAHDFNNLLGAVVGSFDLIRRRAEDADRVRRFAEAGLQAAERGAKLTGQLLAFSRAQRLELKPLVVAELVAGMRDLLTRTLGPMVRLTLLLDEDRVPILSDPTQLEMAVLNMAINARDAMPGGGGLTISTALVRIEADPDLAPGEYVELAVADTGVGMPPETVARAFDPFFTTKGVGKGTGLGLSQVYGVARQAGGTVRIDSRPGAGTTIHVFLPRTSVTAPATAEVERADPDSPLATATVLVVDDDPDLRRVLAASLESLGYEVLEAEDGPSGLAMLDRRQPDLLILDFAMPSMNGAELATLVRERSPALPIVFASGYVETAAIERAAGPNAALLRKPFRMEQLQAVVTEALATRRS
ncbi:MAG TPA: PAS domain-containing protein [Acetobacteraceae bacterium]|nr:PAS domain-containing protein [Acetobacteraceae bacterium]